MSMKPRRSPSLNINASESHFKDGVVQYFCYCYIYCKNRYLNAANTHCCCRSYGRGLPTNERVSAFNDPAAGDTERRL
jgi:hypothetical protein